MLAEARCGGRCHGRDQRDRSTVAEEFQRNIVGPIEDFQDSSQEWRRLFSELLGTFFLVLVAAGGGMMNQAFDGAIGRGAAVTAPGLMVLAIILFMGKVSGAHLNPAVSLAFATRKLPVGSGPRLHPRAAHRRGPRRLVPAGRMCRRRSARTIPRPTSVPGTRYGWSSSSRSAS